MLEAGFKVTGHSCLPELNLQTDHDKRQQGCTPMLCKQLWCSGSPNNLAADKKFSRSLHHRSSGANVAFEGRETRLLRNARYVSGLLDGLLLTLSSHLHHQSKRAHSSRLP